MNDEDRRFGIRVSERNGGGRITGVWGEATIAQIRDRRYCDSLKDYRGNLLLVWSVKISDHVI